MIITLKNKHISTIVSSLGAEMQNLIDADNLNRLHDGNPLYWEEKSPVLFPIISRFYEGRYTYQGNEYFLNTHGFARFKEFKVVKQSDEEVVLNLSYDNDTLKNYPFKFSLTITYKLENNTISVIYDVKNVDNKLMYFMIGGHPGFKAPLYDSEKYDDYYLKFEKKETVNKIKLKGAYLSAEVEPFLNNEDTIKLKYKMFNPDAFVMKGLSSKYIDLISKNHNKKIRFHFSEFETFAIWSQLKINAPFVCFEPWNGLTKTFVDPIEEKQVLTLKPKCNYLCKYIIEVIN